MRAGGQILVDQLRIHGVDTVFTVPGESFIAARTLQRDQTPEDVVGAAVFLAGPDSDFVTGQTIVIDGGQYFH